MAVQAEAMAAKMNLIRKRFLKDTYSKGELASFVVCTLTAASSIRV